MKPVGLKKRMLALESYHGGVRSAADKLCIDPGYWVRLRDGEKLNPSAATLKKLGLIKEVTVSYFIE